LTFPSFSICAIEEKERSKTAGSKINFAILENISGVLVQPQGKTSNLSRGRGYLINYMIFIRVKLKTNS
jgi:hypothetical protein